jgi:hypothetical protein
LERRIIPEAVVEFDMELPGRDELILLGVTSPERSPFGFLKKKIKAL